MNQHIHQKSGRRLLRGLIPTSRGKLAAAKPFVATGQQLPAYLFALPAQMNMQGNDTYGDCVSAEEAQNKIIAGIYIEEATTVAWASRNGDLNGADLQSVIQQMAQSGFAQDGNVYGDGTAQAIDYTSAPTMQAAIYQAVTGSVAGQIKMGVAADQLPDGAGNANGWFLTGASPDDSEDHCMGVCGYGTAQQFVDTMNSVYGLSLSVPSGVDPTTQGYAVYTWATIGFADVASWNNISGEAWIRSPSTVVHGTSAPTPVKVTIVQPTTPTPVPTPPSPVPVPPDPSPSPVPIPTPPSPLCNRPVVLLAETILAYVATLPAPIPAWLTAVAAEAEMILQALCPTAAARFRRGK